MRIFRYSAYALFGFGALALVLLFVEPVAAFVGAAFALGLSGVFFLALDRIVDELMRIRVALEPQIAPEAVASPAAAPGNIADLDAKLDAAKKRQGM